MFGLVALTFAIFAVIIFALAKIIKENAKISIGLSIIFATLFLIGIGVASYYDVGYVIGFIILGVIILLAFAFLVGHMVKKTKRVFISFLVNCFLFVPVVIFSVFSIYPHPVCESHILVSKAPYAYSSRGERVEIKTGSNFSYFEWRGILSYCYFGSDTIKPFDDEKEYTIQASLYFSTEENCISIAAYGKPNFIISPKKSEFITITFLYNYKTKAFIETNTSVFAEQLLQEKASIALKEKGFPYFNEALENRRMDVFEAVKRSSVSYEEDIKRTRITNLVCLAVFVSSFIGGIIVMCVFIKKDKNVAIPKKEQPVPSNKTISFYKARFIKKDENTLNYSYIGTRYKEITNFSYEADIEVTSFSNCKIAIILGYRSNMPIGGPEMVNISRLSSVAATYQDRVFVEKNSSGYCNCIETIGLIFADNRLMIPLLANSPISMEKTPEEFLTSLMLMLNDLSYF